MLAQLGIPVPPELEAKIEALLADAAAAAALAAAPAAAQEASGADAKSNPQQLAQKPKKKRSKGGGGNKATETASVVASAAAAAAAPNHLHVQTEMAAPLQDGADVLDAATRRVMFSFLPALDKMKARQVCKQWYADPPPPPPPPPPMPCSPRAQCRNSNTSDR